MTVTRVFLTNRFARLSKIKDNADYFQRSNETRNSKLTNKDGLNWRHYRRIIENYKQGAYEMSASEAGGDLTLI